MRDSDNIKGLISVAPNYIGFIFYPKSKRYVGDNFMMPQIPKSIKKVGVFVNETIDSLLQKVHKYELDYVQLHGDESVEYVEQVKINAVNIFKVFSLSDQMPLEWMREYESFVDYFLFDTKTPEYGGSGRKFEWSILKQYNLNKPFLLSGGIALEDIPIIKDLQLENLIGIDVNSKFEEYPGFKNLELVKELKVII